MDQTEALKLAFRDHPGPPRRKKRPARTRGKAFTPLHILSSLLACPLLAVSLTVSIYIYTSPYEPPDALRHLIALTGCAAAAKVGVATASLGEMGYHLRNDADGDGVACGSFRAAAALLLEDDRFDEVAFATDGSVRAQGGATFVLP